jgi:preprotein translocase subunit SecD
VNRYALWKYVLMSIAVVVGLLYTLPNFYGEAPAVQVSAGRTAVKLDADTVPRVQAILQKAGLNADYVEFEGTTLRARFADTDTQIKARDVISNGLNPDPSNPSYVVALNLLPRTPHWMTAVNAKPMYLGLDLRGGVHFLLQVDLQAALAKKAESLSGDVRTALREKSLHGIVARRGPSVVASFHDTAVAAQSLALLNERFGDTVLWTQQASGDETQLIGTMKPASALLVQEQAIKQNMTTLGNRVAGLGTSEPVIQQQGPDRIVVELPGIQDTAKAKDLIGRTATLEVHMVDESAEGLAAAAGGPLPPGDDRYLDRNGQPVVVYHDVVITGEDLADAQPNFDNQTQEAIVRLQVNSRGARVVQEVTRDNVGKRMAIVLFEHGKGEVVTAPVIRSELGSNFQISGGRMTTQEASDVALLLRSGALAAPMEFIEETAIGPSLGADNIQKGLHSVFWGFVAIMVFMCLYYQLFGIISTLSLGVNLLLLIAVLSMIQTTLTLPGIAAIALTLGMAIDANVLVNERVREELRNGSAPQTAISAGYERAWATILDSNITTLIAGLSLLAWGSGPIRGFAIVHCLGILTSMFSAVFFSRGLVNLWYGRQKKLKSVLIGQVWKPDVQTQLPQPDADAEAGGPKLNAKAR